MNEMMKKRLVQAARDNDMALVAELLQQGAPPDCRYNVTPLQCAVRNGNVDMATLLLEKGANPNTHALMGHTALEYAMTSGHAEELMLCLIKLLLAYKATATGGGSFSSYLCLAHRTGFASVVSLLEAHGSCLHEGESLSPVPRRRRRERRSANE